MGSCISKKGAKKKQREHDSTEPTKDCKASLTPSPVSKPSEEEKPVADDVEAVKEIVTDTSTVKKPTAEEVEIAEKPSVVDPLKDASATKKKPERSNSLKKKGSFKKEEASQPSDGLARTSSAKEDVDAILIQCGRLSRSSSGKASNDNSNNVARQYSGSKRQAEDEVEEKTRARPSHRRSASRELTPRSTSLDGSSKRLTGRRVSPSPGRRPEPSPGRRSENSTERSRVRNTAGAGVSKRPAKRGSNSGEIGNCSAPTTTSRSRSPAPRIDGALGLPQSLSRSSSRKAEQSPFRRNPEEPMQNDEESGKIVSSATTQDENVPGKKERRVALKEINGNSSSIRDQLLSCRGAPTLKTAHQAKSSHEEAVAAKSSSHKRNGEKEVLEVYADDQTNGAVDVDEVLAQISRSRSARRSRDQFLLDNQTLFEASGETELKSFALPASVSKAHSILEAVADLNSSVNSNSSMKSLVSNVSFEHGKSARFLASYEETEKSEMLRDFHRNMSARNSNADWTEQGQEESAGSNSQTLSRLSAAKTHRYFSSEEDDLTSFEASAKTAAKTEEKDDDSKSSSSLRQSSARYFNISPEDVLLNPHLGIKKSEESSSRSNLLPVITLGKKDFHYNKRASNLQNGRTFSEVPKQNHPNYNADIDFKTGSRPASDLEACSRGNFNTSSEQ
ncbi:hypothetical protein SUGI_0675720 [Cryptomeria japonica]|uniref:uncharacterized protein At1g65710 isoform X2 n=1 Tax=Cryptomeria japonica TaxID=3369 RepID=UPI002414AA55|nr:uncharacterized protein At1g65710 isoform X2 [Cryptomeria japonica]GLJ33609.1 hypothetical protein SUGI_0675720 [Cryptomeria japonica]